MIQFHYTLVLYIGEVSLTLEQRCSSEKVEYRCITTHAFQRWSIVDPSSETTVIDFYSGHAAGKTYISGQYTFQLTNIDIKNGGFTSSLYFSLNSFQAQQNIHITCIDGHDGSERMIQLQGVYSHMHVQK